jgi:hypothetical protein
MSTRRMIPLYVLAFAVILEVVLFLALNPTAVNAAIQKHFLDQSQANISSTSQNILIVNTTNDSGAGSLRAQIAASSSGDTIQFDPTVFSSPATITLTSGQITINNSLTIDGSSVAMPTISGNNASRVFWVNSPASVIIRHVAIVNGKCVGSCDGGGIWNGGFLYVYDSTFRNNNGVNKGGAILNAGGSSLTVRDSTFVDNQATQSSGGGGGGIYNDSSVNITNSTFSGNQGYRGGGIFNTDTLYVTNVTFSGNGTIASGGGGTIRNASGTATFTNSILANSSAGGNCSGTISDGGYNLDSANTCALSASGSLTNTNPLLDALSDNGGKTPTFAFTGTSPALDRIPQGVNGCGAAINTDQRGVSRPQGDKCDMGSYEWQALVTNTNDNGVGSLRQTIAFAPSGRTINFDPSIFSAPATITLTSGQIEITKNLTVDASSVVTPNISGNSASRIFWIDAGDSLTLTNLAVINGICGYMGCDGGGIWNGGVLLLDSSLIANNQADGGGSGILNALGATLTVSNSEITNNSPVFTVGSGGGIRNDGTLLIINSKISDNSAADTGGGVWNGGTLTVTNSTFSGNHSDNASYGGGGLYNYGITSVEDSTFTENNAAYYGGGIWNVYNLSIANSTFSNNNATHGAGIYNAGTLETSNSLFQENSAVQGGGGIYNHGHLTITDSTFSANDADAGGGIYNFESLTTTNSMFSSNDATWGGGIYNYDTLTMTNSTLSDNTATSGDSLFNYGTLSMTNSTLVNTSATDSANLYTGGTATLINSIIANSSTGSNCTIYAGSITDGGYNLESNNTCSLSATTSLTDTNPQLAPLGNYGGSTQTHQLLGSSPAVDKIPSGINGCGTSITTDQRGVARPFGNGCDMGAFERSTLVANTNDNGSGSLRQVIAESPPGDTISFDPAVFSTPATITLTSGQIEITKNLNIYASSATHPIVDGGNVTRLFWIDAGVSVTFTNLSLTNGNCISWLCDGGGIWNGGTLVLNDSLISNNHAHGNGSGILNASGATLTVSHSEFANNSCLYCPNSGGGIRNDGSMLVTHSQFINNSAGLSGGGIWNGGTMTIMNSYFSGNYNDDEDGGGAGIWNTSISTIRNCTFVNNHATRSGGGIWNSATLTVTNSTFSGNSATYGGNLYIHGTLMLTHSTLVDGSATYGGSIRNDGSSTFVNSIIANSAAGNNCSSGGGSITDGGYNLDSANTCSLSASTSLTYTNPSLAELGDYGGDTPTIALNSGGPAIDRIPSGVNGCGTTITTDQRGITRPQWEGCDIGAYEAIWFVWLPIIIR